MKLLYDNTTGKIFYAVYDRDWFAFTHTTNIPMTEKAIDELDPTNKAICIDLVKTCGKTDAEGDGKYRIGAQGQIAEKMGWEEKVDAYL